MPSSYTLNNGIELIGTGEQSGTWGDTTNTNLELLDVALDGQVTITAASAGSSGSPNSLPISDGSASNGRNRLVNITSGTNLGSTVYYQLTPNDAEKIIYIRNSLNTQDLIVFQGTYNSSNDYVIPNGTTAVIFFNGAGSGAVAANVFDNLQIDALNVESAASTTAITIDNTATDGDPILGFALSGTNTFTMGVDDGDSDKFKIGTTAIGTDTRFSIDSSGNIEIPDGTLTVVTDGNEDTLVLKSDDEDADSGPKLQFNRNSASPADSDYIGVVTYRGRNSAGQAVDYANINVQLGDVTDGTEDGTLTIQTIVAGTVRDRVNFRSSGVVFNDEGQDIDFRVETENQPNAFVIDAADDTATFTSCPVTMTHGGNGKQLELVSTDADGSSGPQLDLYRNSASPDNDDYTGRIKFISRNNNSQDFTAVDFLTRTIDVSDGSEDATLFINTMTGGSTYNRLNITPTEVVLNEEDRDVDFRVESDTHTHALFVDGASGGVLIGDTAVGLGAGTPDAGRLVLQALGASSQLNMYRADSSISGGDTLGLITAYSNDTNGNAIVPLVKIAMTADGTFSATDNPTKIEFYTTPDASETIREVARFDNAGNFRMAATSGTIYTETSGTSNLRIGQDAGDNISSGGNYNTLIGTDAGTAITTGDSNVALGYRALYSEDGHGDNTAIGTGALQTLNAGTNAANVSIGNNSGTALTDGLRNVIIGYNAASAATTPDDCVIIGWEAAHNATLTGHDSVIIGKQAGYNSSTGGASVFVGVNSGVYHSTGNYNTFLGYEAGYGNTSAHLTGDDNTAVGMHSGHLLQGSANGNSLFGTHSGDAITTGQRNTALGFGALNSETTGTRATAVGYNALAVQNLAAESHNTSVGYNSSGAVTSGDHNTAMGYGALDDCDDGDNNVAIGSGALSANAGDSNTAIGHTAGNQTTGTRNTFLGQGSGYWVSSGNKNSILGPYDGNQGGLDIRTSSNNIVLSDGDGTPRVHVNSSGHVDTQDGAVLSAHGTATLSQSVWTTVYTVPSGAAGTGTYIISTHYAASNATAFSACAIYLLENSSTSNFRTVVQSNGTETEIRMNPSNLKQVQVKQGYFGGSVVYHWSIARLHYQ